MYITKVSWEINRKCNADCIHCYMEGSTNSKDLSKNDCKTIIDRFHQGGVEELSITGGEPTLSKNFHVIVTYASSKGMDINVITNGFSLNKEDIVLLESHNIFPAISFHAGCEESFRKVYRVNGKMFHKFIENLDLLSKYSLSTCLMKENKNDIDMMAEIVSQEKEKITKWSIYNLRQIKRGFSLVNDVPQTEKVKIKKYLEYRCSTLNIPLDVDLEDKRKEDCPLVYGQTSLFVDPVGKIRPCYALIDFVSDKNLIEHSLEEILNTEVIERWRNPLIKFDNRCKAELLERGYLLNYVIKAGGKEAFLESILSLEEVRIRIFDGQCRLYNPKTKKSFVMDKERKDIFNFNGKTVREYFNHLSLNYKSNDKMIQNLFDFIKSLEDNTMLALIKR